MKRSLVLASVMMVMLFGLNACCAIVPGKVVYSDKLKQEIKETNAKAVILVTAEGETRLYNEEGGRENISDCVLPKPDKKSDQRQDQDKKYDDKTQTPGKVCKGLSKGSAVTSLKSLSILKSNSQECITVGTHGDGTPKQVCW